MDESDDQIKFSEIRTLAILEKKKKQTTMLHKHD